MNSTPESIQKSDSMATLLREHFGPYYDEVFLAAERVFPSLTLLQTTKIIRSSSSDTLAGGLDGNGSPVIHMGVMGSLPQRVRERLVHRLGLSLPPREEYDEIFRRVAFAHEIGHILQADPGFDTVFGSLDRTTYIPEDNYEAYVKSERELNADYIAARLIASTELGQKIGATPPSFQPTEWRAWAYPTPNL